MSSVSDRLNRMPRSMRWLLAFAAFLALYFGVLEPALTAASTSRDRADRLEATLRRERSLLAANSQAGRELERGVATYGLPRHPTDTAARPEMLQRAVNAILVKHGVGNAAYSERSGTIPATEAATVVGAGARLERFVLDVTFEASPENAIAILADLEQASEVTAVSRIKLDKSGAGRARNGASSGSRVVRVTIAVESWIASPGTGRSTASAGWERR